MFNKHTSASSGFGLPFQFIKRHEKHLRPVITGIFLKLGKSKALSLRLFNYAFPIIK